MVAMAMRAHGWDGSHETKMEVEDTSGRGGSKTYKVSQKGCVPNAIAVHVRNTGEFLFAGVPAQEHPLSALRTEAAAKLLGDASLAPKRIAQGFADLGPWYIETWEGTGRPEFGSDESYKQLGDFLVKIHKLPTAWYDEWRQKFRASHSYLEDVPLGSHAWLWTAGGAFSLLDRAREDCRALFLDSFFGPSSPAAQRIVTSHADFSPANLVSTCDGLKCLDLEFSCVSHAVMDLGLAISQVDFWSRVEPECRQEKKRVFLQAYLEGMGDPHTIGDVDALLVDAELAYLGFFHDSCPLHLHYSFYKGPDWWKARYTEFKFVVDRILGKTPDPAGESSAFTRENLIKHGMQHMVNEWRIEMHLATGRLMLVPKDSPHRCIIEHAATLQHTDGKVRMTLSSHPGMAIVNGKRRGPRNGTLFEWVGIGLAGDAISLAQDGLFLCEKNGETGETKRLVSTGQCASCPVNLMVYTDPAMVPSDAGCVGQQFCMNEDGTISPQAELGLVLGASQVSGTFDEE